MYYNSYISNITEVPSKIVVTTFLIMVFPLVYKFSHIISGNMFLINLMFSLDIEFNYSFPFLSVALTPHGT